MLGKGLETCRVLRGSLEVLVSAQQHARERRRSEEMMEALKSGRTGSGVGYSQVEMGVGMKENRGGRRRRAMMLLLAISFLGGERGGNFRC